MTELQTKLLGSLDSYWQTIVDKLVAELYAAYPNSRGDTRMAVGAMNGDPISLTTAGFNVLIAMPDYYEFMDKGVQGTKSTYSESSGSPFKYRNKYPNIGAIRDWMYKRSITKLREGNKSATKIARPTTLKRSKRKKNTTSGRKDELESRLRLIAFLIARSIFEKGLKASNFYSNVINDKEILDFEQRLLDEFGDFITEIVRVENK